MGKDSGHCTIRALYFPATKAVQTYCCSQTESRPLSWEKFYSPPSIIQLRPLLFCGKGLNLSLDSQASRQHDEKNIDNLVTFRIADNLEATRCSQPKRVHGCESMPQQPNDLTYSGRLKSPSISKMLKVPEDTRTILHSAE